MAFPGKKHLFSSDFVQGLPWPMAVLKAAKNWKLFCADTCNWATFKMPSITTDGRFFLLLSHSSEGLTRTPNSWYFHRNIFHPVTLELLALCWHFAESKWSFTPLWMTNWRKLLFPIEKKRKIHVWKGEETKGDHWEETEMLTRLWKRHGAHITDALTLKELAVQAKSQFHQDIVPVKYSTRPLNRYILAEGGYLYFLTSFKNMKCIDSQKQGSTHCFSKTA